MTSVQESRLLRACRREEVDATPVWLMRQAGRYMPEYRKLREKWGILDLIRNPELAVEVTMQPIEAFDLDAAIIFSDILPILEPMGLALSFVRGEGPHIANPVRTAADVDSLRTVPPEDGLHFTLEAIRLAKRELANRGVPLIGFSGAPYTLASYAIEGGGSRHHINAKRLMMSQPTVWGNLMSKLANAAGAYLQAQAAAGADVLQVFDSWAGELSPDDYRHYVLPHTRTTVEMARQSGVPVILFGVGTASLLELMASTGADVIGIDWRVELDEGWRRIGHDRAIQGNLDPVALFADWDAVRSRTDRILQQANRRSGHIFNLGHGILPNTPVETVKRLVDYVHEVSVR
ncbi:MAG: uroporphyrinogen decarboxylase [Thermomicrobiales bacterium]|nr:uroporphyrinogen decarboxylase [Thermomicrobiales bacterium]